VTVKKSRKLCPNWSNISVSRDIFKWRTFQGDIKDCTWAMAKKKKEKKALEQKGQIKDEIQWLVGPYLNELDHFFVMISLS